MHFDILTLFPEMFSGPLSASILGESPEKRACVRRYLEHS